MCYDADAAPPVYGPPVTTTTSEPLVLTSAADGAEFGAYVARPGRSTGVGVLVLPDNRGLSPFYERLAVRLAEQGHPALAIDYFGRSAGVERRAGDFPFMEHIGKLTKDGLHGDIATGAGHLRAAGCDAVVSLGFCMGGRLAFISALPKFGLAGVIGLYGYPDQMNGVDGPAQMAAELAAPILAMFGGGDEHIPAEVVAAFGDALAASGAEHEIVTYPGAPHSFFELGRPELAEASANAWSRILGFLRQMAARGDLTSPRAATVQD